MTQSHKSKQILQVLSKKPSGKWKRKTVVLKRSAESQKTGELEICHPFLPKPIRKMDSIQLSPYSHAVIQGLSEDNMSNVLGLLKLEENNPDNSPCRFFCVYNEQEVTGLHKLAGTIQELCQVHTFAITIDGGSTSPSLHAGPAYLHIGKNRVFLSSRTSSTITILKEWQFHSLQTFQFEVCGIHIFDTVNHSQEGVFVSCRSKEDNHRIQQIISSQCNHRISPDPQSVLPRRPNEPAVIPTSSSDTSFSSSMCSWELQSPTESPVFCNYSSSDIMGATGCHSESISTIEVKKGRLKQTQSRLPVKKTMQSPEHSVKEHVNIRFPTNKRSQSESDLIRPFSKEQKVKLPQSRTFSLDSDHAFNLRKQKSTAFENVQIKGSVVTEDKSQGENTRESSSDTNAESTQQQAEPDHFREEKDTIISQSLLPPKCELSTTKLEPTYQNYNPRESDSLRNKVDGSNPKLPIQPHSHEVTNKWTSPDSPHYINCETRPNCFVYRNMSCLDDAPEVPATYVNVFSGSSIKGCYENCHSGVFDFEINYLSRDEIHYEPPPLPQPRRPPPRLPPRIHRDSHKEMFPGLCSRNRNQKRAPVVPQRPPKRPPKSLNLKSNLQHQPDMVCNVRAQAAPKIHVALFVSLPTCGLVWFLRVAFMHQDENNTTFKQVTAIEEASKHKVVKSQLLEVSTDINVAVDVQSKGFDLLNDSQQGVESKDIDNLRKGDWFVIEFRIRQSDQSRVQFDGEVSVGPEEKICCGRLRKVSFGISENFLTKTPLSPSEKPTSKPLKINFSKYNKLCKALDPITNTSQDWRYLADALEFPREDIEELVSKYHRNVYFSPTDSILQTWEQRDPECSLKKLVNILRELERYDVVQDLGYSIEPEEKFNDGFKKI